MHEEAVGPAVKHAMDPNGWAAAQAAEVIVARGVEASMETGLDGPVLDIGFEPLRGREFSRGSAGDQPDRFGLQPFALTVHLGSLRHQRKAGGFPVERSGHQCTGHRLAFFEVGPADGGGIFQRGKRGEPGSGTWVCTTASTLG